MNRGLPHHNQTVTVTLTGALLATDAIFLSFCLLLLFAVEGGRVVRLHGNTPMGGGEEVGEGVGGGERLKVIS